MIKKFVLPAAIAGSLLAGSAVQAASIVNLVDPLIDVQEAYINMPEGVSQNPANPDVTVSGGLLNGVDRRMMLLQVDIVEENNGNGSNSQVPVSNVVNDGFSLSNDVMAASDATLNYGTSGSPEPGDFTPGFTPVDFTVGGADTFTLEVIRNDHSENEVQLTVNGFEVSRLPGVIPLGGSPVQLKLPFSDFIGVDFTQVTSLALELNAVSEGDIAVREFATSGNTSTPEPATMLGLLAVGALGFASRRRQK